MTDFSHLDALNLRLSHEREYLARAKRPAEIELRKVWIAGIEKEIVNEYKFLGIEPPTPPAEMSDDELLAELTA
jgi:hypothetical protein